MKKRQPSTTIVLGSVNVVIEPGPSIMAFDMNRDEAVCHLANIPVLRAVE